MIILVREGAALAKQSFQLNLPMVALSVVVSYGGLLLAVVVWHRILASFGIHHPFRANWRIYSYSVVGVALPGSIWPLAGRTILYQRLGESPLRVAATTVVECDDRRGGNERVCSRCAPAARHKPLDPARDRRCSGGGRAHPDVPPRIQPAQPRAPEASKQAGEPVLVNYRAVDLVGWLVVESAMVVIGGVSLFMLLGSLEPTPPELCRD